MTREDLLATAGKLRQPEPGAAGEFNGKRDLLAERLNRTMSARPDLERLIGPENLKMMEDNSRNFMRFMDSMYQGYSPEVLVETVLWVFRAYRAHGFRTTYWPANLDTCVEILREELSPDTFRAVCPFYDWLIVNIPVFVKLSEGVLTPPPGGGHE